MVVKNKMKRFFLLVTLCFGALSGCASISGTQTISSERFDHILTQPLYVITDTSDLTTIQETLTEVNTMVNKHIRYTFDIELYNVDDYWASPTEVLRNRRGDCEDYAFLKREILISMGIPKSRLKLIHVDVKGGYTFSPDVKHFVLGYYHTSDESNPILLDNMFPRTMYLSTRYDLRLNYVFDESNVWATTENLIDKRVYNTDIIPKFTSLLQRHAAE